MGFKSEQFLENVDENLFCSICHEVFQDPVSCKDGHTFCSECIERWLKTSKSCPMDNSAITDKLVRNLIVSGIVDNLYVFCRPHGSQNQFAEIKTDKNKDVSRQLKCDWTGRLQSLAKHRTTCPFQQVQCPNVNCNTTIQRRESAEHDKICEFKIVLCSQCRKVLIRHELQKHLDSECPESLVACPNNCTFIQGHVIRVKRIDLTNHLANICAKTILDCPFKDQGCSIQVERQHLEKHVQDNMASHMMLLGKQCSSLTEQNSALTDQNTALTEQYSALAKKCSSLTEQCSALTEQYSTLTKQCSSLTSQCSFLTDRCSSLDQRNVELVRELDSIKSKEYKWDEFGYGQGLGRGQGQGQGQGRGTSWFGK